MNKRNVLLLTFAVLIAGIIAVVIRTKPVFVYDINADEVAVLWKRFGGGTQLDKTFGPGRHIIAPWDLLYRYPATPQEAKTSGTALSKAGWDITFNFTAGYRINPAQAPLLHQQVGSDYEEILLLPSMSNALRQQMGNMSVTEICEVDLADLSAQALLTYAENEGNWITPYSLSIEVICDQ